jgi:hypothetical protein
VQLGYAGGVVVGEGVLAEQQDAVHVVLSVRR